ncbi:Endoglucanase precursor [compost metagenome]
METSEPSLVPGKLTSAGNAVNIKAAARNADGSAKELSAFTEPIQIHFSYQGHESDENLLGVYAWNTSTSKWDYIGAKMNKKGKQISAEVSKPGIYTVMSYHASFSDLPASHWAHDAVVSLAARHIINGMNEDSFAPQGLTTRAEFAAMLVRALGIPSSGNESATFSDVKANDWFVKDVNAAMAAGLIKGVDEQSFAPNQIITREQMAVLLLRALEYKKQDGLSTPEAANSYADQDQVSSWAQKAVDSVTQLGLMKGKGQQKFDPLAAATRAETAKVMNELLLKLDTN